MAKLAGNLLGVLAGAGPTMAALARILLAVLAAIALLLSLRFADSPYSPSLQVVSGLLAVAFAVLVSAWSICACLAEAVDAASKVQGERRAE